MIGTAEEKEWVICPQGLGKVLSILMAEKGKEYQEYLQSNNGIGGKGESFYRGRW